MTPHYNILVAMATDTVPHHYCGSFAILCDKEFTHTHPEQGSTHTQCYDLPLEAQYKISWVKQ